jgi:hypothetical protein
MEVMPALFDCWAITCPTCHKVATLALFAVSHDFAVVAHNEAPLVSWLEYRTTEPTSKILRTSAPRKLTIRFSRNLEVA